MLQCDAPMKTYVDSKTVLYVLAKQGKTCEKRLQIEIHALG